MWLDDLVCIDTISCRRASSPALSRCVSQRRANKTRTASLPSLDSKPLWFENSSCIPKLGDFSTPTPFWGFTTAGVVGPDSTAILPPQRPPTVGILTAILTAIQTETLTEILTAILTAILTETLTVTYGVQLTQQPIWFQHKTRASRPATCDRDLGRDTALVRQHTAAELFDAATQDRYMTCVTMRVEVDRRAKRSQR